MRVLVKRAIVPVILSLSAAACRGSSAEPPAQSATDRPIAVGAVAPRFTLQSAQGGDISLADFVGKKPVLLFFSMGPG